MSLFLDFRTAGVGGGILDEPRVLEGNGLIDPPDLRYLGQTLPAARIAGREVVFVTHGFNVSRREGVHALARLERDLNLPSAFVFVGVLWPGDWCRPAREVCVLAAAVDDDCLTSPQYDAARKNAKRISVLASRGDLVLRVAYPAGDFFADIFYDDDNPARKALGYHGPRPRADRVLHAQIPDHQYGHGDYFPPADLNKPNGTQKPEAFISEALLGVPHGWP